MKKINIIIAIILLLQVLCIAGISDLVPVKVFTPDENTTYIGFQEKRSGNWEGRCYLEYSTYTTVGYTKGTSRATWLDWIINYASTTYSDATQM